MNAACSNNVRTLTLLLDSGANMELENKEGETLLLVASTFESVDCVRLLIMRGADCSKINNVWTT